MVFDCETSPSHRIINHIPIYKKQKSIAGPSVAEAIGIDLIRQNALNLINGLKNWKIFNHAQSKH